MGNKSKSSNTVLHHAAVSRTNREHSSSVAHKSLVVWFTGLSGSGKSTIAHAVEEELFKLGAKTYVLDGDNVRHGLNGDLGFSDADRNENIRRIGEMVKLFLDAGIITLAAFISPFHSERERVRALLSEDDFVEIHCKCLLTTCEQRDIKGLYKKARKGEIKDFTGISSPYEEPSNPDLVLDTDAQTLSESVDSVLSLLVQRGIFIN